VQTTDTGDGQVVKLHRGVGHNKTEGRALLAGTIAHSARDRVCSECRGIRAIRRVAVGFRRGVAAVPRTVALLGMTFIICDRHREDARHLPGAQRRRAESDVRALRRGRANDEHVRGVYLVHDGGPSHNRGGDGRLPVEPGGLVARAPYPGPCLMADYPHA
jgi:hypothetical protein